MMAVAVLDFDISDVPDMLDGFSGYTQALVLLRIDRRPVGQAMVPLKGGQCPGFRARLLEAADSAFWEAWLRRHLGLPADEPAPGRPLPSATVAVCTRDRVDDLRRCLPALLAMPDHGQSIIVVDNAPSDDSTRALVETFPRIRYVRELRPGLDVARNRALEEARSEVVAFIDDDAVADPAWLQTLLRNFADPLVMAATGTTMALELETEAQVAFQRYGGFLRGFKRTVYDAATHDPFMAWQAGAGVNMALRRSVLEHVGRFDEALDAGTPTQAGGDSDMFRRILANGFRIAYDPQALNWHRHRRTLPELERQVYGYEAAASAILTKALVFEGNLGSVKALLKGLRRDLPILARAALRRPGTSRLRVALVRLRGTAFGPFAYLRARKS